MGSCFEKTTFYEKEEKRTVVSYNKWTRHPETHVAAQKSVINSSTAIPMKGEVWLHPVALHPSLLVASG